MSPRRGINLAVKKRHIIICKIFNLPKARQRFKEKLQSFRKILVYSKWSQIWMLESTLWTKLIIEAWFYSDVNLLVTCQRGQVQVAREVICWARRPEYSPSSVLLQELGGGEKIRNLLTLWWCFKIKNTQLCHLNKPLASCQETTLSSIKSRTR